MIGKISTGKKMTQEFLDVHVYRKKTLYDDYPARAHIFKFLFFSDSNENASSKQCQNFENNAIKQISSLGLDFFF